MDNPRGVSSCHVLSWAFGDAYLRRENVRHATLLFCALGGRAIERKGAVTRRLQDGKELLASPREP